MPNRLPIRSEAGCISGIPIARHDSRFRPVNRRTALRLAGAGVVGAAALAAATGCAQESELEPDPLLAQELLARTDAAAATAAVAVEPQRHGALTLIAAERTAHAEALRTEIDRLVGVYGDGTVPSRRQPEVTVAPAAPVDAATLRGQLTAAQQSAADLARTQSGYRAGLLASISAACAVHAGVLLA
ncbi:hypothetical protein [Nocardia cyriacigeorgica]|uniref:hypothetical protein n=1 Tax=Nocardia cyriacigeorgica TaxID=135487 RepID=UPI0028111B49|nr:hypothetical protein [Nocardia cyriacigeorgica]